MGTTTRTDTKANALDVLLHPATINWENPGGTEVAVTGAFISGQGGRIHHGLGGSSELNVEQRQFEPPRPYLQLEEALRVYIPNVLGIKEPSPSWDALADKIGRMEKRFGDVNSGLWHSLWYKMGQQQEVADAWLAFIPDQWGLGIVKAGLALIFKLAESSVEKRKLIFDTFAALRDSLIQAHPQRRSFRKDQEVNECVDRLYQAVVDSIQDLAALLVSEERSNRARLSAKFRRHKGAPLPRTEEILERVKQCTKDFHDALRVARDRAIEGTEMMSRVTGITTVLMHERVLATEDNTDYIKTKIDKNAQEVAYIKQGVDRNTNEFSYVKTSVDKTVEEVARLKKDVGRYTTAVEVAGSEVVTQLRDSRTRMEKRFDEEAAVRDRYHEEYQQDQRDIRDLIISGFDELKNLKLTWENQIAKRERGVQKRQEDLRTQLLHLLLDQKSMMQARIAQLEQQVQYSSKAVVSLDRFCEILAKPFSDAPEDDEDEDDDPPDLAEMFQHPAKDLRQALAEQCTCSLASQGQVQSLLGHKQFIEWLNRRHPALILVDANIEAAALDSLSVISVFCATFITSMMEVNPDDVMLHFFCGLHFSPSDPWHGPNGLVRSLIMQLLMKLVDMDCDMTSWNLDFINDRDYLEELERHDLNSLCATLHSLLYQFPPDTPIYCIIDSVSTFNVDRLFDDFRVVMDCLRHIVDDRSLAPIFKVLLTNPSQSTLRVKQLPVIRNNPSRLISLSEHDFDPTEISTRVVERCLLRTPSPHPALSKRRSHSPLPPKSSHRRLVSPVLPLRHGRSQSSLSPLDSCGLQSPLSPGGKLRQVRITTREVHSDDEDSYSRERW
ncbi:hypothetical protein VTK26DRAFT_3745 [Humicola hyalothermophila]